MTIAVSAQTNFAGKWVMQPSADAAGGGGGGRGGRGGLGQELTITQDAGALTLEYVGGGQNPAPVKLVYKLDGSESKNMMMGRGGQTEQVSKAAWTGSTLTITTTTQFGEQKRTLSLDGGNLVIETSAPGRDGGPGMSVKQTYKKAS
ncbi:MAG: hypothetical protein IT184_02370 [Acidobacteria bacterium]|nr:hypothetical protein [Acidobacteriota bacterium]